MYQVGLDGGKPSATWLRDHPTPSGIRLSPQTGNGLPDGKLRLIEQVVMDKNGGANQAGYVYASRPNSPTDWYYT